jgi:glycosyltransferase involved in cell wall biosynthesis
MPNGQPPTLREVTVTAINQPLDEQKLARVDVVIPVYNEQVALPVNIPILCDYLEASCPYDWRVVIADNASIDDTPQVSRDIAASYERVRALRLEQKGRGRALRTSWLLSDADVVSYMDVDLSTNLKAFMPLVEPLVNGQADIAIGTRLDPQARVERQWKREFISRSYNAIIKTMFRNQFSDAQCGFKAMTRESARFLLPMIEDNAWFFDTELLLLAEAHGVLIREVPVDWVEDLDSRVKIVSTAREDMKGLFRVRRALRDRADSRQPTADSEEPLAVSH